MVNELGEALLFEGSHPRVGRTGSVIVLGGAWRKYKGPRYVGCVDEIFVTLSGQVHKFKVRQFEIEARGMEKAAGPEAA
jgi:hypothetical protein